MLIMSSLKYSNIHKPLISGRHFSLEDMKEAQDTDGVTTLTLPHHIWSDGDCRVKSRLIVTLKNKRKGLDTLSFESLVSKDVYATETAQGIITTCVYNSNWQTLTQ